MHRSGLALAGAETTLEAWKRGDVPPIETDGIVTAEDISTIDLKDTWLVTLSACDTGSAKPELVKVFSDYEGVLSKPEPKTCL